MKRACLLILAGAILLAGVLLWRRHLKTTTPVISNQTARQIVARLAELEARENEVAEIVWAKELLAQRCGRTFEELWDAINTASNKWAVISAFEMIELTPPNLTATQALSHGITLRSSTGSAPSLTASQWRQFLVECEKAGWQLEQTEFRHNRFETDTGGHPKRSEFFFLANLTNLGTDQRATLSGDLTVDWASALAEDQSGVVKRIDASRLSLVSRRGSPPFQQVLFMEVRPPEKSHFVDPLILYDLDRDGRSEIILACRNLVLRNHDGSSFIEQPLCRHSPGLIFTGVIADFDGDGAADFLCARFEGLLLFRGSKAGSFDEPGRAVWNIQPHLKYAQVLTCGDVDGDGDLDVWLGQYKGPYERGQMPTPYFDANDGNPSFLLLNDGHGNFTDTTEASGLGKKRWRRVYSGSLVDIDNDGDLDLLVISDFAGVDVHTNDGRGRFADATSKLVPEPRAFGMAHALADFNLDGRLDIIMMGMHCPTALRLDGLGLVRPGFTENDSQRARMTSGNRLYLAKPDGSFQQDALSASIARSGWSWACAVADYDNDGYPDVYVANGHETRQSVRDYEPEFWLHDIYVANSRDDVVLNAYFASKFSRTRGRGQSYGGYEKNRLFLNRGANGFIETGHIAGVAIQQDCRNTVADDLNADGRMDMVVTSFEVWPVVRQTVRVFLNTLPDPGNWIGFRFREQGSGCTPVGARVALEWNGLRAVRHLVTGDSHRSQQASTVHFGLGAAAEVDRVRIRWANGSEVTITNPAINTYHTVSPAESGRSNP